MSNTMERWQSEKLRRLDAEAQARGEAKGEARGEARAVLTVLGSRGVQVPDEIADQVLACTDLNQIQTWLQRAGTADSIDDVITD